MRYQNMLKELKPKLDEIDETNDRDFDFVEGLIIKHEEGKLTRITDKQLVWLRDCYMRYVQGC